jgi:C4-dicarboxylate-specific signal transduction histidine kinase
MKYSTLILDAPFPIALIDESMTFIDVNNEFASIVNAQDADDIIGNHFSKVFESIEILSRIENFMKQECLQLDFDHKLLINRKMCTYQFTLKKIFNPNLTITLFAVDHTLWHETKQELESLKKSVISSFRMASLGEMAAGIVHEINNPICIISLFTDQILRILPKNLPENEHIISKLQRIKSTTGRIDKIIKGLKAHAREGSEDQFQLNIVKDLIDDSLTYCVDNLKFHNINLIIEDIPAELQLECRAAQISQVFLNLISNAKDAIKDQIDERWIKISVKQVNEMVEFSLTDSGKGIPPEIKHRILEPFYTTKPNGEGTGLGLSITKNIIEAHSGKLYIADNTVNTKIVFAIPSRISNQVSA